MAGSVGLVYFEAGDDVTLPEFRERLNALAQQGADATAWNFGFGLIGAYTPGTGFTLAVDEHLMPPAVEMAFLAEITEVDGLAASWKEMERTGTGSFEEKEGGRVGFIDDVGDAHDGESAAYEINAREGVAVGTRVMMWEVASRDGTTRHEYDLGTGLESLSVVELGNDEEGGPEVLTDTWSRTQGQSARVWFQTRTYSADGTPVLGFKRFLDIDTNGHIYYISDEHSYEIDPTESCEGSG